MKLFHVEYIGDFETAAADASELRQRLTRMILAHGFSEKNFEISITDITEKKPMTLKRVDDSLNAEERALLRGAGELPPEKKLVIAPKDKSPKARVKAQSTEVAPSTPGLDDGFGRAASKDWAYLTKNETDRALEVGMTPKLWRETPIPQKGALMKGTTPALAHLAREVPSVQPHTPKASDFPAFLLKL